MAGNDQEARGPAAPAGTRPRRHRRVPPDPGAICRSLLLGVSVFVLAALAGALLSGAAPAADRVSQETPAAASTTPPTPDRTFAHSMVVSGAGALAVSVAGLVMVARRRRLW